MQCDKKERFENPDNKDTFTGDLLNILDIRKAPLGKWPSRYMPKQKLPEKVGKIFSVNGPPGTGKTLNYP